MVFDSHLSSLRDANIKTLWEDDVHPHYVMRRYSYKFKEPKTKQKAQALSRANEEDEAH
jgi:hypothetical protein